jgi:hypothetical protein
MAKARSRKLGAESRAGSLNAGGPAAAVVAGCDAFIADGVK